MDGTWTKMNEYRKQGLFIDVFFVVGGENFKAHKVVLSCQSPVLEVMFTSGMEEAQTGKVNIIDIKPEVFELFLTFIYTREVPETALSSYLEELLYCADKYAVPQLTDACSQYLENHFSLVRRLFLADKYHLSHVKIKASEEIAIFGWERLNTAEWYQMFGDFSLTTEVLHFVLPSSCVQKWTITPDMWFTYPHSRISIINLPHVRLRNNGHPCEISVRLIGIRKTIRGLVVYHPQINGPKAVELSFEFSIGAEAHFCGNGDVWWDEEHIDYANQEELSEDLFEHTFCLNNAINSSPLEFILTLRPLPCGTPKAMCSFLQNCPTFSDQTETAFVKVENETFSVNKSFVRSESEFFRLLMNEDVDVYKIEGVDVGTFRKLHPYLLTGKLPFISDTEVDLETILCGSFLSLNNMCKYLAYAWGRSLDKSSPPEGLSRSIELLISARDDFPFAILVDSALSYIDCHFKEVLDSPAWARLNDRPDLLYKIVQRLLDTTDPAWSECPDSDGNGGGSETEVETMMDCLD